MNDPGAGGDSAADEAAAAPAEPPAPESARGRGLRWASVAWLTLLGAAAVIVGGHDTTVGREISVRITGSAVLGAGVVLLAGALGLRGGRPQGEALASLAALLGTALGLLMFLTQAVNDDPDSRLFIWGAIIALSLGVWAYIRSQMTGEERERGMFNRLPVLKSALSVGFLLSVAQFWHSSIYLPTRGPMSVVFEPALESPERRGGRFLVRGTVSVRNASSARVLVLGSSIVLSGQRVRRNAVADETFRRRARMADRGELDEARMYPMRWPPDVISRGRFVPDEFYFEPDETYRRPFIAWFPEGFDVARVEVQLVIARPTVGEADPEEVRTTRAPTDDGTVITRPVPEDGWLQGLTRDDRFTIATYYDEPWDGREFYPVVVDFGRTRNAEVDIDFSDRMWRFYGVAILDSTAFIPFPGARPSRLRG